MPGMPLAGVPFRVRLQSARLVWPWQSRRPCRLYSRIATQGFVANPQKFSSFTTTSGLTKPAAKGGSETFNRFLFGLTRRQSHRRRCRRSRPATLRELRLWFAAQLHRLLQSRARTIVRSPINGSQSGNASEAGLGDRKKAGRGRGPSDHLLQPLRLLLAAAGEGLDDDGQQHHQQLSYGGCLVG